MKSFWIGYGVNGNAGKSCRGGGGGGGAGISSNARQEAGEVFCFPRGVGLDTPGSGASLGHHRYLVHIVVHRDSKDAGIQPRRPRPRHLDFTATGSFRSVPFSPCRVSQFYRENPLPLS